MEDTHDHSRRKFLGTMGKTAAAAAGITLLSARSATASEPQASPKAPNRHDAPDLINWTCCVSTCRNCGAGYVAYDCVPNQQGCSSYCTSCIKSKGTCYYYSSGAC